MRRRAPRLADDLVGKDLPWYLEQIPVRQGDRPRIVKTFPCLQEAQEGQQRLSPASVVELARALSGVTATSPRQTISEATALVLCAELAAGQEEAFILGREFAHVRGDASVHLTLYPEWADLVIARGWAQPHPLALYGLIPPQNIVVYAPCNEAELDVVALLLVASYSFAAGRTVEFDA